MKKYRIVHKLRDGDMYYSIEERQCLFFWVPIDWAWQLNFAQAQLKRYIENKKIKNKVVHYE